MGERKQEYEPIKDEEVEEMVKQLEKREERPKSSLVVFWFTLNIVCSVGIVMMNKWVFEHHNFKFGTTLAFFHFLSMYLVLQIGSRTSLLKIEAKSVSTYSIMPLVASFIGFVVLTNLSLRYNSVGVYQCAKILSTPCTALILYVFYKKGISRGTFVALVVVCMGVGIATVTDFNVNFVGTVFALSGTVVTSIYYILVGQKQKELEVTPLQLLYVKAPLAVCGLLLLIPIFDNVFLLFHYEWTFAAARDVVISCILAILLNLSTFATVGKTSALAFSIVGHLKTCGVFLFGYLIFDAVVTDKNLAGIFITVCGIVIYSYLNLPKK